MISSKTISIGILRAIGILVFLSLLLFLLFKIRVLFVYLIISLVLTMIGNPLVSFLKKRLKFNNTFAVITTVLLFILIVTGLVMMFIPLIISQGESLSLLDTKAIEQNIDTLITQMDTFLRVYNIDAGNMLKEADIASKIDFNFIPYLLNSIVSTIGSFGVGIASVLFITFFFLKDRYRFVQAIAQLIPENQKNKVQHSVDKINNLLSRYFVGLLLQLFIVFILYFIVLVIFGVKNALVIAFLCALLNIIPYIGPLMGMILAAILTMISNLDSDFQSVILPTTLYVMIGFIIVQVIDNNVNQPLIFSNSVKSHPLEIFLVILAAGFLSGIVGMIIAVPSYTILKVLGKEFFPNNRLVKLLTKNI